MITVKVENLHLHVTVQNAVVEPDKLDEILTQLTNVRQDIKEFRDAMKLTDQELTDLLNGIDKTTNHTADNVQAIANVTQTIKTEIDGFIASAPAGTVLSDAQVAQLQGIAAKAQAASDAGDAQVAVLQAVAAEGQPVVPAPPPPVAVA
jgi:ABC-type transporter Mla subunit MlaD